MPTESPPTNQTAAQTPELNDAPVVEPHMVKTDVVASDVVAPDDLVPTVVVPGLVSGNAIASDSGNLDMSIPDAVSAEANAQVDAEVRANRITAELPAVHAQAGIIPDSLECEVVASAAELPTAPQSYRMHATSQQSNLARPDASQSSTVSSNTTPSNTLHATTSQPNPSGATNLAEIIVVTSGKGGVGKTTTSASLACGLARHGKKVAVIDFDVGLRNLDLIMGCERRVVYDFVNVINGECTLRQALIKDKRFDTLHILAASQTRDKDALTKEGVEKVLTDLGHDGFDFVVCDSPAGIEKGAFLAMYFADRAVVVVNPEVSSVRDSDRILGLLASKTRRAEQGERVKEHLLLTRYDPKRVEAGDMLSIKDVQEILGLDVVGVIPEAPEVLQSSNSGEPVILDMESNAGQAYDDAVLRILGQTRPLRFTQIEKKGFFSKMFGG